MRHAYVKDRRLIRFDQLQLAAPILRAVTEAGYETPTPIQSQAIPPALEGRDVLGTAQTGTGKTAAFALPMLHRLATAPRPKAKGRNKPNRPKHARCLVLCPTRELATQIAEGFQTYGKHLHIRGVLIFGGVNQRPQVTKLMRGVDVVVATPGRLLDLINQGHVRLSSIQSLVLDEADRMLDMGFLPDLKRIISYVPDERQTMMFSATMPPEIRKLANAWLHDPAQIAVAPDEPTVDRVAQSVYFVDRPDKPDRLAELMRELGMHRTIVFTRTKHGADRLVKQLRAREIASEAIHGNKSQNARQRTLDNFKKDKVGVLIATDIAARGIDVDGVTHVVNYDLTHEPETYVHRIGRTARAGASGVAITLCGRDEVKLLRAIERLLKSPIPVVGNVPAFAESSAPPKRHSGYRGQGGKKTGRSRSGKPSHAKAPGRKPPRKSAGRKRQAKRY